MELDYLQVLLLEINRKIVTLTNSYNEMARLKSGGPISSAPEFNLAQYKQKYMESLSNFQNQQIYLLNVYWRFNH